MCAACFLIVMSPLHGQIFSSPLRIVLPTSPAKVVIGDLNLDGRQDLVYYDSTNSSETVLLADGAGGYTSGQTFSGVNECLIADVTADGVPDLICGAQAQLNIYRGVGDGTFTGPLAAGGGTRPVALAVGDVNGDGRADIIFTSVYNTNTSATAGYLTVALKQAGGTYVSGTSILTKDLVSQAQIADLDGNGQPDIVYAVHGYNPVQVAMNGNGTYPASTQTLNANGGSFLLSDVNGDGYLDLIGGTRGVLTILRGQSSGVFAQTPLTQQTLPPVLQYNSGYPTYVAPLLYRDLDGDGIADLLAQGGDGLQVLRGTAGLVFQVSNRYMSGLSGSVIDSYVGGARVAVVADLDGDGSLDVVAPDHLGVYVNYGRSGGTFSSSPLLLSPCVNDAVAADFNEDGTADLFVLGDSAIYLRAGLPNGSFAAQQVVTGTGDLSVNQCLNNQKAVYGDFNGDRHQDVLITSYVTSTNRLLLGNGNATFNSVARVPAVSAVTQDHVRDLNNDGRDDFIITAQVSPDTSAHYYAYLAQSDATFAIVKDSGAAFSNWTLADVNGDGLPDLISTTSTGVMIRTGRGDGTFATQSVVLAASSGVTPTMSAVGDFDGDGRKDIASVDFNSGFVSITYGLGFPGYSTAVVTRLATPSPNFQAVTSPVVADLNGDGIDDLLVGIYGSNAASLHLGKADRTLSGDFSFLWGSLVGSVVTRDLNSDGLSDLLTVSGGGNNSITVLVNKQQLTSGQVVTSPEPSRYGNSFQITASLAAPDGATLAGSVAFAIDGASVGSAGLSGNAAALTVSQQVSAGIHDVTATWSGDSTHAGAVIHGVHTVRATSNILLTVSGTSVFAGDNVTFSAAVSAPSGTIGQGQVTFYDGSAIVGYGALPAAATTAGTATLTLNTLIVGTHTITARYAGNAGLDPAVSTGAAVTVKILPTTLTLIAAPNSLVTTQSTILTASVLPTTSTGSIRFSDGATALGEGTIKSGQASLPASFSTTGMHSLTAAYSGDSNSAASNATLALQISQPPPPAVTPASLSFGKVTAGKSALLSVTISNTSVVTLSGVNVSVSGVNASDFTVSATACRGTYVVGVSCALAVVFRPSTGADESAVLTVTGTGVAAQTVPLAGTGVADFTLAGSNTQATVSAGTAATYTLGVDQSGGFTDLVTMSCANLPQYASCSFSPASFTPGSSSVSVSLSISTQQTITSMLWRGGGVPALAAMLGSPLLLLVSGRAQRTRLRILIACALLIFGVSLNGCAGASSGGNSSSSGTGGGTSTTTTQKVAPGTYNVQVNATSSSAVRSSTVSLVVQ